jgi:hypothetical protein
MRSFRFAIVFCAVVLVCATVFGQNESKARPKMNYEFDQEAISKKILENTDASVGEAVAEISKLLSNNVRNQGAYATIALRWKWGDEFLKVKRYEELLGLCKMGIFRMAHERTYHAGGLQRMRVMCLLSLGRNEEALSHAKLYFNMCVTAETAEAVRLLVRCLAAARPGDAKIIERFKEEQIAGAVLTNAPPSKEAVGKSVLGGIELPVEDIEEYERQIERRAKARPEQVQERTALGNFLIMAGRAAEAKVVFEETFGANIPDNAVADALENVAIAIRACDESIGRANAYILANQGEMRGQ